MIKQQVAAARRIQRRDREEQAAGFCEVFIRERRACYPEVKPWSIGEAAGKLSVCIF
jgi:hypothetical protein